MSAKERVRVVFDPKAPPPLGSEKFSELAKQDCFDQSDDAAVVWLRSPGVVVYTYGALCRIRSRVENQLDARGTRSEDWAIRARSLLGRVKDRIAELEPLLPVRTDADRELANVVYEIALHRRAVLDAGDEPSSADERLWKLAEEAS